MPPYGTTILTTDTNTCQEAVTLLDKEGYHPQAIINLKTGEMFDPFDQKSCLEVNLVVYITVPPDEVVGAQRVLLDAWQARQRAASAQASSNGFKMLMISVAASLAIGGAVYAFSQDSMAAFEAGVVGFVLSFVIALVQFESARQKTQEDSSVKDEK